jgi:hypothetical protein
MESGSRRRGVEIMERKGQTQKAANLWCSRRSLSVEEKRGHSVLPSVPLRNQSNRRRRAESRENSAEIFLPQVARDHFSAHGAKVRR